MAHPLVIVMRRLATLESARLDRGLSPDERAELDRLMARKAALLIRLPREIAATHRRLARLQRLYFSVREGDVAAPAPA